ncbi:MerR family transcriptional regulator [Blautia faecicola]|jgi:DNA-binding transcriptional MerR regulator|uniref:MerR family transcriptional regulator n=1 Tax=Blautia faecicola TaxID=2509240 RepID=A0A4Q1RIM8_9FIRM|nr:MerR family transcriptional regulator [Blautia faecicola]RXS75591.1 MerR family transcriptional regulator [Blautia faecicola]CDD98328.1 merR-family transcriptional regulator [Roseburia sp. CAG:471]
MQKFSVPCIKTGDFAKLCNTNKRTLIHYDEIGLFSPAYTDEKGYRYYSENQCDTFFTITCLKEIGMPLKEIKQYIDHKNPEDLQTLLLQQQQKVEADFARLHRIRQVIDTKLQLIHAGEHLQFSDSVSAVSLEDFPEEYLIVSPPLHTSDHEKIFSAIYQHIAYCNHNLLNAGHPYGAMLATEELLQGHQDVYAHFFTKVIQPPTGHPWMSKPAGTYAVIYLKGDYYEADQAFETLLDYIQENNLTPGTYCYKEAVLDEMAVENETQLVTRISIPV